MVTRVLSAGDQAALAAVVTTPTLLVDWVLTSQTLYYSTRATLDNHGHTYVGGRILMNTLSIDSLGGGQAQITLLNHDQAISSLVLNEDVIGTVLTVYYVTADDRVTVLVGQVATVDIGYQAVNIQCVTQDQRMMTVPKVLYVPPLFNHIPPPGTELVKGDATSKIASREAIQNTSRSRRHPRTTTQVGVYKRQLRRS